MVSRRPPPVSHLTFDKFTRAHTQALSLSPRSSSTAVSFTVITHDSALFVYSFRLRQRAPAAEGKALWDEGLLLVTRITTCVYQLMVQQQELGLKAFCWSSRWAG